MSDTPNLEINNNIGNNLNNIILGKPPNKNFDIQNNFDKNFPDKFNQISNSKLTDLDIPHLYNKENNFNINNNILDNKLNNIEPSNGISENNNNNIEINIYKTEINKLNQENNSLKAKIIDIEQIISKYKESNNEYNNYIKACYIFFNNISQIGLNQIEFTISQYNNKLMNLDDFRNKLNIIENYIILLQKEIKNLNENTYKNSKNDVENNKNYELNQENNNSYYNNENISTKKINNSIIPNCSNIANYDEDYYNDYNCYENNEDIDLNNENNNQNVNQSNDNNNNLAVEDLNLENNNINIKNNINDNYDNSNRMRNNQYEIYKTLEERVNMLEKELNMQKQNYLLYSNNKRSKNQKSEIMYNNYFIEKSKEDEENKTGGSESLKEQIKKKNFSFKKNVINLAYHITFLDKNFLSIYFDKKVKVKLS